MVIYQTLRRTKMAQLYEMLGGGTIAADTNQEIVAQLRAKSFTPGETETDFMEQTSAACKMWNNSIISTYNYDEFVTDLIENKFITPVVAPPAAVVYQISNN